LLERRRVARFPMPLADRIPNFKGAEQAAAGAATLPEWQAARRIKCNPDAPQRALRLRALQDGKLVFMAVPRLREARCFLRLDPARLEGQLGDASTWSWWAAWP
jgi:5-formyltetrahydrofolate cyclo-ligase